MTWNVAEHLAYLLVTVPLTIWVASTLSRNGRVFLHDVFERTDVADATNHLLVVGFYLLNLGFVLLWLRSGSGVSDLQAVIESLSLKVGVVMLALGVIHMLNVSVFSKIRRRGHLDRAQNLAYQESLAAWANTPGAPRTEQ